MKQLFYLFVTSSLLFPIVLRSKPLLVDDFSVAEKYNYINNSVDLLAYETSSSCMKFSASGDYLITPQVTAPTKVSFTIRSSNSTVKLVIEEGEVNGDNVFVPTKSSEVLGGDTNFSQRNIELSGESQLRLSKLGTGTVYIDDLEIVDNEIYLQKEPISSPDLRFGLENWPVYVAKLTKNGDSPVVPTDSSFSFTTAGTYGVDDLAVSEAFNLYLSTDMYLSDDDVLLGQKATVLSGQLVQFPTLSISLEDVDKYVLVTTKLAAENPSVGERTLSITMSDSGLSRELGSSSVFKLRSAENIVAENYTDWQIAPSASFLTSEGLLSSGLGTGLGTISYPSKVAHGQWSFTLKYDTDWSTSTQNNFFVILTSDKATDLTYGNLDFNGYFLRFSTNLEFCRQDGTTTTVLGTFSLPTATRGTVATYDFVVNRSNRAEWELKINDNSQFVLTDSTYRDSSYFAISKKINNPSSEKQVNIEDLTFSESLTTVTPLIGITLGFLNGSIEIDLLDFAIISEIKLFYMKGDVKTLYTTISPDRSYFVIDIEDIDSDLWFAEITEVEGETETFYITKEKTHETFMLEAGRNLLATDDCDMVGEELEKLGLTTFWTWRNDAYEVVQSLGVGEAFWVYAEEETVVNLAYHPKDFSFQIGDEAGWQLCTRQFITEYLDIDCYGYNGQFYDHINDESELKPFTGYWKFIFQSVK